MANAYAIRGTGPAACITVSRGGRTHRFPYGPQAQSSVIDLDAGDISGIHRLNYDVDDAAMVVAMARERDYERAAEAAGYIGIGSRPPQNGRP